MGDGLVNFYLKLTALTCSTSSGWADQGQGLCNCDIKYDLTNNQLGHLVLSINKEVIALKESLFLKSTACRLAESVINHYAQLFIVE